MNIPPYKREKLLMCCLHARIVFLSMQSVGLNAVQCVVKCLQSALNAVQAIV